VPITFPVLPTRPASPTHSYTIDRGGGITVTTDAAQTIYMSNIDDPTAATGAFFVPPYGSPALYLDVDFVNQSYVVSTLNNAGIIWNSSTIYGATGTRTGHITNSGWIIAESTLGPDPLPSGFDYGTAVAVQAANSLANSGTIYAFATGFARAVSAVATATIDNSGTIAARAVVAPNANVGGAGGYAIGIEITGAAVEIVNQASGSIVAEGPQAVAISMIEGVYNLDDVSITNHGLIEAVSTNSAFPSMAISIGTIFTSHNSVVNDGTIRGDIAIFAADVPGLNLPVIGLPILSTQIVRNLAGGLIDGAIDLNLGDDALYNAGTIVGHVDLGDGWDLFDGTGGTVDGLVDLGIGSDLFIGGPGGDITRGGFGNDDMTGGGGNDLLIGDSNADVLEGQAGNDGLYGGTGDDWLITQGADFADGGRGDDLFTSEDYTFAQIIGGTGADIWQLPTGTRALDLATVLASGRISGIDQLELSTGKTLTIREADVIGLSDDAFLALTGGAGSTIYLPENWSASSPVTIAGHKYIYYTRGSATLVVDIDATVAQGLPPAPGGGLDAVAPGGTAPLPGIIPGTTISNLTDSSGGLHFIEDQTIDLGQTVESTSGNFAVTTFTRYTDIQFDNYGIIRGTGADQAGGFYEGFVAVLRNYGGIIAHTTGSGPATAVLGNTGLDVYNSGLIDAAAGSGQAIAVSIRSSYSLVNPAVTNDGDIWSTSETGRATGVHFIYGSHANVVNNGDILVAGFDGAIGIDYEPGYNSASNVTNTSFIGAQADASATGPVIGVRMIDGSLINSGTIQSRVAVQFNNGYSAATLNNSGMIVGDVQAGPGWFGLNLSNSAGATIVGSIQINTTYNEFAPDAPYYASTITNRGTITGDVRFGAGYDVFDTAGGTFNGSVYGGLGNDTYKVNGQATQLFEYAGEGTDTVETAASYYLFANLENLTLTGSGNAFGVGNELANALTGNGGANLLIAGAGDDVISGGAGNDQLFGEDGADTLNGDAGIDYLAAGTGNDVVNGGADADNLYGEDGDDLLDGGDSFHTDILTGGAGNDTLDGISGQANPDYDLMDGGSGDDIYWVDTGDDLTFESVSGGTDTVHADVTVPNAGVYLYANVENLVLEGTTAFGVGNELANQLTGSASGNWLLGGAGSDRIAGLAGNDVLFGEAGADTFVFGAGSGADLIGDFAIAQDVIEFASYFTSFAQAQANFVQVGADGAIDLGNGELIVLLGVTMANLTAANFTFTAAAEPPFAPKAPPVMEALSFALEPLDSFADHGLIRWHSEFGHAIIP
jgi:Ca2+-binding RTX toxin-like protein